MFAVRRGETTERIDVHYHKPEYRLNKILLCSRYPNIQRLDFYADVYCGPFGTAIKLSDYRPTGIPLLRISNITKQGTIDTTDLVLLSKEKSESLARYQVKPGDLVISQRGTLGMPAFVPKDYPIWIVSANLIAIHARKGISASFVQKFLSSQLGQKQLERRQSGQVQGKITTEDVASVLVPKVDNEMVLVRELEAARSERQRKLEQAESLLAGIDAFVLEQLGIRLPQEQWKSAYAISYRYITFSKRLNADYYHPERLQTIRVMEATRKKLRSERLSTVVDFIREMTTVAPNDVYLGLANVQSNTGELVETDDDAKGNAFVFQKNDILFARLRPYLNKVYLAEYNGKCSTEFHVLRVRDKDAIGIILSPTYLATILRSSLIIAQTKHMMTGNTHPRLTNEDVKNLVIPIPESRVQDSIVAEERKRRQEARRLRQEVEAEWQAAKARFEKALLGEKA